MSDAFENPISPALREVLAFFRESLHTVKFPDVDADALTLQAMLVEEQFAAMKDLESALRDSRQKLEEAQEALLQKAWRAVAYARVYADGDEQLTARLEAIPFPVRTKKTAATTTAEPPKKRGRKAAGADASLFTVPDAVDVDVEEAA
ncbi:MAG: hypothetical protein Q8O67_29840 [Deltaproteobacteria bacterium]|nr:hypothetical protein [Deltaproteobacteria bacterium]